MLRQELDFELTGDDVRRPDETVHVELWDTFLVKKFQVRAAVLFGNHDLGLITTPNPDCS